ncbi:NAD-P-binding protein [Cadophora sp. DSE1049]|nr:NAD-P-binding protein [Cadophora sp. DSE1049]
MSSQPKPIRVALIGLSSTPADEYEGTNWAASAHLPYLLASPHYEIAALLNSSVESARRSIEKHGLPGSVKAYGSPEDLASDPTISLIVCSTRVDRHFSTVRPSIIAGKDVFVEWPLEKNLAIAKEMNDLAKKQGGRTLVGLQGRYSEPIVKVKELVWGKDGEAGRIGKVLGSTLFAALGVSPLLFYFRSTFFPLLEENQR